MPKKHRLIWSLDYCGNESTCSVIRISRFFVEISKTLRQPKRGGGGGEMRIRDGFDFTWEIMNSHYNRGGDMITGVGQLGLQPYY